MNCPKRAGACRPNGNDSTSTKRTPKCKLKHRQSSPPRRTSTVFCGACPPVTSPTAARASRPFPAASPARRGLASSTTHPCWKASSSVSCGVAQSGSAMACATEASGRVSARNTTPSAASVARPPTASASRPRTRHGSTRSNTAARPWPPPMHIVSSPYATVATAHLAQQRRQYPAAGRADGVAERDARAVHVDALQAVGKFPLAQHREDLCGERLVELDQTEVRRAPARRVERTPRRPAPARCPSSRAGRRRRPSRRAGASGCSPSSAAFSACVTTQIAAPSF